MTRITLTDNIQSVIVKLAEGNPGALTVCIQLLKHGGEIDPDSALGGLGCLLSLDTMGIYGSKIWILFKDICGQDLVNVCLVQRGHQLGFLTDSEIHAALVEPFSIQKLDLDDLRVKVSKRLPAFQLDWKEKANGRKE